MKNITKLKLAAVHQFCGAEDKSTVYMLQLMQDSCKVSLDTCLAYLNLENEHQKLFKELNELTSLIVELSETP